MSEDSAEPSSKERRSLRRLRRASSCLFLSVLLPFIVPVAIERLLPALAIDRQAAYTSMTCVYVAALTVFVFLFLRCPRCRHPLWSVHLQAEFGKIDGQGAACPGCGLDLEALLT